MTALQSFLARHPASMLVEVTVARGSTPRDAGTFMVVAQDGSLWGTIGGGQLEFIALEHALGLLAGRDLPDVLDIPLGPEIGQCCGGRTGLRFQRMDDAVAGELHRRLGEEKEDFRQVAIFGAGHVGQALAAALSPLPFRTSLIESREIDLTVASGHVTVRRVAMPEAEISGLSADAAVVIVTHDHALDFLIAAQALARDDLAYVGMIGSDTKRATFASWLAREGADADLLSRLTLPIGGKTLRDKRPAVIAALVAAELLSLASIRR